MKKMMSPSFRVEMSINTPDLGVLGRSRDIDRSGWIELCADMLLQRDQILGPGRCVIDPTQIAEAKSPVEHVIPQGTGIKWIALPRGATAASSNNRASRWEMALLRDGLMGMLRPFYSNAKKSVEFLSENGVRIVFRNDPGRGFVIETHNLEKLPEPPPGPGQIRFSLQVVQAPTAAVSRALTKIAYLALVVTEPTLAFSQSLDAVRNYLVDENAPYRPYGELFQSGAPPGASVAFRAPGSYLGNNVAGGNFLGAVISIHHVRYFLPLIGDVPAPPSRDKVTWFPESKPAGKKRVRFSMQYDSARPTDPTT